MVSSEHIAKWAIRIVVFITTLWLLLILLEIRGIQWLYEIVADWLSQSLNLSDEISVLIAVIFTAAALPFISLIPFIILRKNRVQVAIFSIVATGIAITLQLLFGQDVFFLQDGTALRCYAMTPDGIKVARRKPSADCPSDKTFQVNYMPMTRQIVPSVLAAKRGIEPTRIDPESFDGNYVGGTNGRILVWYYQKQDGVFDLFNGAGFHPQTGQPLLPVDSQAIKSIDAFVQKMKEKAAKRQADATREIKRRAAEEAAAAEAERINQEKLVAEENARQELLHANEADISAAREFYSAGNLIGARRYMDAVIARDPKHSGAIELYGNWNLAQACNDCGVIIAAQEVEVDGSKSNAVLAGGGIVGGVIGHQVGQQLATVAGGVIGAVVIDKLWRSFTSKTVFVISLQMDDGNRQSITFEQQQKLPVGQRVMLVSTSGGGIQLVAQS